MSNSEPKYFDGWDGPLLPYSAFHEYYTKDYKWEARQEFVIPRELSERIRITIERGVPNHLDMRDLGRYETLADHNIYDAEEDAKEFAKRLMDTLFYHCSEYEMRFVMMELAAYCNGSELYRRQGNEHREGYKTYELIDSTFTKESYATVSTSQPLPQCSGEQKDEGQEGLQSS